MSFKPAYLKPYHDGYKAPTHHEVRRAFREWNRKELADMLGVSERTLYRWMGRPKSTGYRQIPYPAWRLFLILSGALNPYSGRVQRDV